MNKETNYKSKQKTLHTLEKKPVDRDKTERLAHQLRKNLKRRKK